jgi:hypothetical protein
MKPMVLGTAAEGASYEALSCGEVHRKSSPNKNGIGGMLGQVIYIYIKIFCCLILFVYCRFVSNVDV